MSRLQTLQDRKVSKVRGGVLVQSVYAEDAVKRALTVAIPLDDTIPQNTEGTETLTASITPRHARNRLRVRVVGGAQLSTTNFQMAALFRDSAANAVRAYFQSPGDANRQIPLVFEHEELAGSVAPTTFKLRLGPDAGTMSVNQHSSGVSFGGLLKTVMIIDEIEP